MTTSPLVIERTCHSPVNKAWKALTDKEQMKKWYFDISEFKAEPGFEFTFTGENEGKVFIHLCKIIEVIPLKKLSYSWRYKDYQGNSTVTFDLFREGDDTRIKLTHEGLESFPPLPDFAIANFLAGWTHIIGSMLPTYLGEI